MTLTTWIESRSPAPPERLRARLEALVGATDVAGREPPEVLVAIGGDVLGTLLREGQTSRDGALAVLAADALVTYAFEFQTDVPERIDARCSWAMRFLSGIADSP